MDDRTAHERSKHPKTVLAGPYGHPFHAIAVTVPIGAWTASLVFDLVGIFGGDDAVFAPGALWLIGIGVVSAVLAATLGLLDLTRLASGTKVRRVALTHATINLTVIVLFTIGFFVRLNDGYERFSPPGFVISLVALALLAVSGYLGGELAYRYGVRVADERTQDAGFH